MRSVFHHQVLRWRATGRLPSWQARLLLVAMQRHRQAWLSGTEQPPLPKALARRLDAVLLWVLFRLSVERPVALALGRLLVAPAALLDLHRLGGRLVAACLNLLGGA